MTSDLGPQIIGPFRVLRQLGAGGMGVVFLVEYVEPPDGKTGEKYALKLLPAALLSEQKVIARFKREIEILKRLKHSNIVRILGSGKYNGQPYVVMEYMDGGSLEDRLKKHGPLTWEQAVTATRQIASALEYLHNNGIIHRDLKPANFLLAKNGRLKLSDFGIARDTEATALTDQGKTVGTYAYMAPEQITGQGQITKKTDLYALGVVLFEMIAGRTPFEAETAPQMLFQHLEDDPPDVSEFAAGCPQEIDLYVDQLLAKQPDDRPYDALAVHTQLGELRDKLVKEANGAGGDNVDSNAATSTGIASVTGSDWEYMKSAIGVTAQGATGVETKKDKTEDKPKKKKKKRKKKREFVPFYEQTWFLVACLILILGGVAWALWPLSEAELYERVKVAMDSGDRDAQHAAQEEYIHVYLEKYPDGAFYKQMVAFDDQIEVDDLEERVITNRLEEGKEPRSDAGKRFGVAWRFEKEKDRATAIDQYEQFIERVEDGSIPVDGKFEKVRHYRKLAERRIADIEAWGAELRKPADVLNDKLRDADELATAGNVEDAKKVWEQIIDMYGNIAGVEPQVGYARQRRDGDSSATPPYGDASPSESPN